MKTHQLENDMTILYVQAASFPNGVQKAFHDLDAKLNVGDDRLRLGLSHGSQNGIVYMAGVEEAYAGEGRERGCPTLTLKAGTYLYQDLKPWREHLHEMGDVFKKMLATPNLDTSSPCVELYYEAQDTVRCMVRIIPA